MKGKKTKRVSVVLRFSDEAAAAGWFTEARSAGLIPGDAMLRHADTIDTGGQAVRSGTFIASREPGPGPVLVEALALVAAEDE